jgi:hypothetical protein
MAAIVAVIVVVTGGGRISVSHTSSSTASAGASSALPSRASRPAESSTSAIVSGGRLSLLGAADATVTGAPSAKAPAPATPGRQIVQSAQLALSARANHVDDVAQQVFNVVAAENGVVENSNVTSTSAYGNAQFSLSVPSANLSKTLDALSQLSGANVVSRSDATQDITGQVGAGGRRLAEARALRTSLLRQLAAATTAAAVSSLKTQIRDADASISSDLSSIRSLQHKVARSQISVTINSVAMPLHPVTGSGGAFTLSRAVHDAGRVLVVAAGIAVVALAVLVPLGLVVALGLWLAAALRRRRREQVLDLI